MTKLTIFGHLKTIWKNATESKKHITLVFNTTVALIAILMSDNTEHFTAKCSVFICRTEKGNSNFDMSAKRLSRAVAM